MKLKRDFITHLTDSESLLVPTGKAGFSGLVRGNKTLGAILELLKKDISETEIVAALQARFDAPEDVIAADVKKALANLRTNCDRICGSRGKRCSNGALRRPIFRRDQAGRRTEPESAAKRRFGHDVYLG